MNILLLGGSGFIGTNLTKKLLNPENNIVVLDNLSSSDYYNIQQFKNHPNYSFIKGDIVDYDFSKLNYKFDEIYNLACPASPPRYQEDPIHTLDTCTAVKRVCEYAKLHNSKVLHFSTSEIYGDPLVHPQIETYRGNVNTIGPRSCYDEGKRVAESYCYEYRKQEVDVRLIRIFNTYGPWMDPQDGRVISNFIVQALKGEDITIYGDGTQTRSFQYITDLLAGIEKVMSDGDFGPVNLGNPVEFTIKELADLVLKLIPESTSKIVYKNLPTDDPCMRKPDITWAKERFGWKPEIQLETGLTTTIKYFRSRLLSW